MPKNITCRLTGGTFLTLLEKASFTRISAKARTNGQTDSNSTRKILFNLLKIIDSSIKDEDFNGENSAKSFKEIASKYKNCNIKDSKYYVDICGTDSTSKRVIFIKGISTSFDIFYKKTEEFCNMFIDVNQKGIDLANRLLKLIELDDTISENETILLSSKLTKKQLKEIKSVDLVELVLSILFYIISKNIDNKIGRDTILLWNDVETFNSMFSNLEQISELSIPKNNSPFKILNTVYTDEHVKSELEIKYASYIDSIISTYSNVKTILYRNQPINFYDIYVCNDLSLIKNSPKDPDEPHLKSATPKTLFKKYGNHITITGPGGYGKTMLLKHLLLCDDYMNKHKLNGTINLIPIYIPLKAYSPIDRDLVTYVYNHFHTYDSSNITFEEFEKDLQSGGFMILFDALDEISPSVIDDFSLRFDLFSTRYTNNAIVLSSRPSELANSLTDFASIQIHPFDKKQAQKMVSKLKGFDNETITKLLNIIETMDISDSPEKIPLLLTLKILIYSKTGIYKDNESHTFFENAYHILYSEHDIVHNKFLNRNWKTKLNEDEMLELLGWFGYLTFVNYKPSFTREDIKKIMDFLKENGYPYANTSDFIHDVFENLSLFVLDGNNYSFIHRSFEEYFTCVHLMSLKKEEVKEAGIIKFFNNYETAKRIRHENGFKFYFFFNDSVQSVFKMFAGMSNRKFIDNYIIPFLEESLIDPATKQLSLKQYICSCYKTINWTNGYVSDGVRGETSFDSEILQFLLTQYVDFDYFHVFNFSSRKEEYIQNEYFAKINDKGDFIVTDLIEDMKIEVDENGNLIGTHMDGVYCSATPNEIYSEPIENKSLIEEMEWSIGQEFEVVCRIYKTLKKKNSTLHDLDLINKDLP